MDEIERERERERKREIIKGFCDKKKNNLA